MQIKNNAPNNQTVQVVCVKNKSFIWSAVLIWLFLIALPASATHFRYGHITWTEVGEDTVEFTVTTAWRTAFIGSYNFYFGDGSRVPVYSNAQTQLFTGMDLQGESYTITQYKTRRAYHSEGPFTAYFSSCCRIGSVLNASHASYRVEAIVDLRDGNTGSPVSSMPVILQMQQGQTNTVPIPIADPDGDSFTLRMATAAESGVPGVASTPSHSLELDADNNLVWNTEETSIGQKYAAQVLIEENHSGNIGKVALDFIIEIVGNTASNSSPTCNGTTGLKIVQALQPFSAAFTAEDSDGDSITVQALGLPPGATMTPSSGSTGSSPLSALIEWTPQTFDVGVAYAVTVIFEDPDGLQCVSSFSMQVQAQDTDGDGVPDDSDEFPSDSTKAFISYGPAKDVFATIAFEDNWPERGDYDFNDLVLDYNFKLISNASNELVELEADLVVRAAGAAFQNGFGIQLPFAPSDVAAVTGSRLTDGYINVEPNGLESGQSLATLIIFDNTNNLLGGSIVNTDPSEAPIDPVELEIVITMANPVANALLAPPFNPFLIVNKERGREVHLPDMKPTDLADASLFGTGVDDSNINAGRIYRTARHLPWAINVNEKWDYPVERVDIVDAHLKFPAWAQSSGANFQQWYQNKNGYRNATNIYSR
ncbi:MAG: LruC domain-containing protein [Calditrichia bacterium]